MDEPQVPTGWTIETYATHNEAMRRSQATFEQERDRRYSEVAIEREKALKIKETADLAALGLARDIQVYKDEKANELRSQIERERGTYVQQSDLAAAVSKFDVQLKPALDYVTSQQGRADSRSDGRATLDSTTKVVGTVLAAAVLLFGWLNYQALHRTVNTPPTVTVTVPVKTK
jgi:hypothetical protein